MTLSQHGMPITAFSCNFFTGTSVACKGESKLTAHAHKEIPHKNSFPQQTCGKPRAQFSSSNLPLQTANAPLKPSTLLLPPTTSLSYTACKDSQPLRISYLVLFALK